jgi:trk system potassium uptake protein TrkA
LRRLGKPAAFDTETFLDGQAELIGLVLDEDCPVVDTPLRQLSDLFSTLRAVVVGVRREGKLFVPNSAAELKISDEIYVFAHIDDTERAMEIFGKSFERQERLVILGGGNVGLAVAKSLEQRTKRVRAKIIERNRGCAERAAEALERTVVLNGDGLDMELQEEAGIAKADAILAVTDDDKTNILACVRAKSAGAKMAICLINDPTLTPLMAPLDIDAYINPRTTTVSSILRHIRHGRVRDVYSIGDAEAEVIEAQVLSTSQIAGKELREIDFPEGVLIGVVRKGGEVIRPAGETKIEEGDVITIFSLSAEVPEVEKLLQVSVDFF